MHMLTVAVAISCKKYAYFSECSYVSRFARLYAYMRECVLTE